MTTPERQRPELPEYHQFTTAFAHQTIAEAGYRTAEYVLTRDFGCVALVDRLARNFYIPLLAAHRELAPDRPTPSIYFLNPFAFVSHHTVEFGGATRFYQDYIAKNCGFSSTRDMFQQFQGSPELKDANNRAAELGLLHLMYDVMTGGEERVLRAFEPVAKKVMATDPKYNGRVLVMDGCAHTGFNMRGIVQAMRNVGVPTVRKGVILADSAGRFPIDFAAFKPGDVPETCNFVGTQDVLSKSPAYSLGVTQTEPLSTADLRDRWELHWIMQNGQEHRRGWAKRQAGIRAQAAHIINRSVY